jgi:hypothetical protein
MGNMKVRFGKTLAILIAVALLAIPVVAAAGGGSSAFFGQGQSQGTVAGQGQSNTSGGGTNALPQTQTQVGGNVQIQGGVIGAGSGHSYAIAGGVNGQAEGYRQTNMQNGAGSQVQGSGEYQHQSQGGFAYTKTGGGR